MLNVSHTQFFIVRAMNGAFMETLAGPPGETGRVETDSFMLWIQDNWMSGNREFRIVKNPERGFPFWVKIRHHKYSFNRIYK